MSTAAILELAARALIDRLIVTTQSSQYITLRDKPYLKTASHNTNWRYLRTSMLKTLNVYTSSKPFPLKGFGRALWSVWRRLGKVRPGSEPGTMAAHSCGRTSGKSLRKDDLFAEALVIFRCDIVYFIDNFINTLNNTSIDNEWMTRLENWIIIHNNKKVNSEVPSC